MLTEKPDSAAYKESALLRGESLYLLGRYADAISILKDAVRTNESAYMLASSYLQVHDVPHSVQAFAEMFAVAPNSAAAHLITGQMTLRQELNDEAEAQLQQALALDAKLPQAHFLQRILNPSRQKLPQTERILKRGRNAPPRCADGPQKLLSPLNARQDPHSGKPPARSKSDSSALAKIKTRSVISDYLPCDILPTTSMMISTVIKARESAQVLTTKAYWDGVHETWSASREVCNNHTPGLLARLGRKLAGVDKLSESYAQFNFMDVILPRLLSFAVHSKAIEIGAAPGENILAINKKLGYIPYGVEYSAPGCLQTRANFNRAGFPAAHVFEADAFGDEFQKQARGQFNLVISLGVIEHFFADKLESVIQSHVDMLAPGGTLIVRIPRLRGLNYVLARLIDKSCLPKHNLTIMKRSVFRKLFEIPGMTPLYSDYQGMAHLTLACEPRGKKFGQIVLSIAGKAQAVLTILMYRTCKHRSFESAALSPFLLYVGRKNS